MTDVRLVRRELTPVERIEQLIKIHAGMEKFYIARFIKNMNRLIRESVYAKTNSTIE